MGMLARFDLASIIAKYGIRHFVETGTGAGGSLSHAAQFKEFEGLYSCEIEKRLADAATLHFSSDPRIHIFDLPSSRFLQLVKAGIPEDQPTLFWLDAHFPGADFGLKRYDETEDENVRLPLAQELRILHGRRNSGDVIIIDDLRIYKDGPFQNGNLPAELRPLCPKSRSIEFIGRIMGETHDITLLYDHEGYIVLTPEKGQDDG